MCPKSVVIPSLECNKFGKENERKCQNGIKKMHKNETWRHLRGEVPARVDPAA